MKNQVNNWL